MPSRVRIIGQHPDYGVSYGGKVVYYILKSWMNKRIVKPAMFEKWPHWKRTLWMAKDEGNWIVKVIREVRKTKLSRSLYGKEAFKFGITIKKPKKKNPVQYKVQYKAANVRVPAGQAAVNPIRNNDPFPLEYAQFMPQPPMMQPPRVNGNQVNWGWVQAQNVIIPGGVPVIQPQDPIQLREGRHREVARNNQLRDDIEG